MHRCFRLLLALPLVIASTQAVAAGALIGDPLPDVTLPRVGGGPKVALRALGQGVIAFSFYSKYCRPCRKELPALHDAVTRVEAALRGRSGAKAPTIKTVVLVLDEAPPQAIRQRLGRATIWLDDREGKARDAFVPRRFPCTYLAAQHRIRKINRGYGPAYAKRVEGWLRQLVGLNPRGS